MVIYKDLYDIIEKTPYFKDYVFKKIEDNDSKNKKEEQISVIFGLFYPNTLIT